jgi:hypothetical protein
MAVIHAAEYADAIPPYSLFLLHFELADRDMATITFDTLKFVEKLNASGIPDEQAKAIVEAFRDAQSDADLVTKEDLQADRTRTA